MFWCSQVRPGQYASDAFTYHTHGALYVRTASCTCCTLLRTAVQTAGIYWVLYAVPLLLYLQYTVNHGYQYLVLLYTWHLAFFALS